MRVLNLSHLQIANFSLCFRNIISSYFFHFFLFALSVKQRLIALNKLSHCIFHVSLFIRYSFLFFIFSFLSIFKFDKRTHFSSSRLFFFVFLIRSLQESSPTLTLISSKVSISPSFLFISFIFFAFSPLSCALFALAFALCLLLITLFLTFSLESLDFNSKLSHITSPSKYLCRF